LSSFTPTPLFPIICCLLSATIYVLEGLRRIRGNAIRTSQPNRQTHVHHARTHAHTRTHTRQGQHAGYASRRITLHNRATATCCISRAGLFFGSPTHCLLLGTHQLFAPTCHQYYPMTPTFGDTLAHSPLSVPDEPLPP
jgi:hypothetical protein